MALDFGALGLGDKIGIGLGVSSLVTGLIGDYSKANTERYRAKSAALNYEHQQDMAKVKSMEDPIYVAGKRQVDSLESLKKLAQLVREVEW